MHTQDSSGVKAASPVQASEGESDKGWKEVKPRRRARSSQESGAKTVTLPASQSLGKQGTAAHAATSVKSPRWSWSLGLRKPGMTYAAAVDSSKQVRQATPGSSTTCQAKALYASQQQHAEPMTAMPYSHVAAMYVCLTCRWRLLLQH